MGLDTTHDAWHGAYSAFFRFRHNLALAAGYEVATTSEPFEEIAIPWEMFRAENYMGDWSNGPVVEDPLLYLIVHSDCDGVIHPAEGRHIAARLEQLLPNLDDATMSGGHIVSMTEKTKEFIAGLREAASRNEDVEFH